MKYSRVRVRRDSRMRHGGGWCRGLVSWYAPSLDVTLRGDQDSTSIVVSPPLLHPTHHGTQHAMDVSPMSMTPSGSRDDLLAAAPTPGAAADTDTTPSVSDAELANQGDFTYDHEHDYDTEPPALGASYFRRTSLAIAAARRFTLYEAAAATPGSPIAPVSPIAAASASAHIQAPAHPSIQFQGNIQSQHRSQTAQSQSVPRAVHRSPPSPTRGLAALGSSLFSRGGGVPARYTSPLATPNEEDEERLVGSGVGGDAGVGVRRAHAANVASHHAQAQAQSQAQGYTTAHVHGQGQRPSTRRRRSSVVQARYRWLSGGGSNTGDEPGVDVRSARDQEAYGHLKAKTHVTVVDYTCNPDMEDANVRADFDGDRLREWLNSSGGQRPLKDGQPAGVRWSELECKDEAYTQSMSRALTGKSSRRSRSSTACTL